MEGLWRIYLFQHLNHSLAEAWKTHKAFLQITMALLSAIKISEVIYQEHTNLP